MKTKNEEMAELARQMASFHEMHGDRYLALCKEAGIASPPPVLWATQWASGKLITTCEIMWLEGCEPQTLHFADFEGDHAPEVVAAVTLGLSRN